MWYTNKNWKMKKKSVCHLHLLVSGLEFKHGWKVAPYSSVTTAHYMHKDHGHSLFVFVSACVVDKNQSTTKFSSMGWYRSSGVFSLYLGCDKKDTIIIKLTWIVDSASNTMIRDEVVYCLSHVFKYQKEILPLGLSISCSVLAVNLCLIMVNMSSRKSTEPIGDEIVPPEKY